MSLRMERVEKAAVVACMIMAEWRRLCSRASGKTLPEKRDDLWQHGYPRGSS